MFFEKLMAAPLREIGFLIIHAAVLAKAQRPLRRNAHYYGVTTWPVFLFFQGVVQCEINDSSEMTAASQSVTVRASHGRQALNP